MLIIQCLSSIISLNYHTNKKIDILHPIVLRAAKCATCSLNTAASVPSAASSSVLGDSAATLLVDNIKTQKRTSQEENSSEERESQISLEFIAGGFAGDAVPVEDASALEGCNKIGEEPEGDHEEGKEDEIHGLL